MSELYKLLEKIIPAFEKYVGKKIKFPNLISVSRESETVWDYTIRIEVE